MRQLYLYRVWQLYNLHMYLTKKRKQALVTGISDKRQVARGLSRVKL